MEAPAKLKTIGRAPDFQGAAKWLNSGPISISELKGKVVMVDFWTTGCVNCINTMPSLRGLYAKYSDKGLVIIGVHTPEFDYEKSPEVVARAVKDYDLRYPVAIDNDHAIWKAYRNQWWPAQYIVDKEGNIRYVHAGEGDYSEIEDAIKVLLTGAD